MNGQLLGTVQIKKLLVPFRHLKVKADACTTRCDVPAPSPACTTRCEVNAPPAPAPTPAPVAKPSENFIKTYGYQIVFGNVAGVPDPESKPPYYFARKIRDTADATIY